MRITYDQEASAMYIYLTSIEPGGVSETITEQKLNVDFDASDQIIAMRLFETDEFQFRNRLRYALQHSQVTYYEDTDNLCVAFVLSAESKRTVSWDANVDLDRSGQILGIEILFCPGGLLPTNFAYLTDPSSNTEKLRVAEGLKHISKYMETQQRPGERAGQKTSAVQAPSIARFRFEYSPLMIKKLFFTPDGSTLFHSSAHMTAAWDVTTCRLRSTCPGALVGFSQNGETFLTRLINRQLAWESGRIPGPGVVTGSEPTFGAWESQTGKKLPLQQVDPAGYPLHQRTSILADFSNLVLQVYDILEQRPPHIIYLPERPGECGLDNWIMTPHDRYLAVVVGGSAGGFDWSRGYCIDLNTGAKAYGFEARETYPVPIYFSLEQDLLVVSDTCSFHLYSLSTGKNHQKITVGGTFSADIPYSPFLVGACIVSVNPRCKYLVAATNLGGSIIRLLDTETPSSDKYDAIKEVDRINDVEFHPNGKLIASLLSSGQIHLWNTETGKLVATLHSIPPVIREPFRPGQRVRHATFGEGLVIESRAVGSDEIIAVTFNDEAVGLKWLTASSAPLERLKD